MSTVAIAELKADLKKAGVSATDGWQAQLLDAADAAGNHDGKIDCAELDAYVSNPKDGKFLAPGAAANPKLKIAPPRLSDEGLAALRSRIAAKTGETDELRIVPHRGQSGIELLRAYSRSVYDGDKRIPAIVGYVLSSPDVREEKYERTGGFREETLLEGGLRASNSDYSGSKVDKGHMRPAEDSANPEALYESFYLSNAVPQDSSLNRGAWRDLEEAIHGLVRGSGGRAVVFTGSLFLDNKGHVMKGPVPRIHDRVAKPTHIFKAVMLTMPDRHVTMFGFVVPNEAPSETGQELLNESRRSIAEIESISGYEIFTDVPDAVRKPMIASDQGCPVLPPGTEVHAASLLLFGNQECKQNFQLPEPPKPWWFQRVGRWLGSWL